MTTTQLQTIESTITLFLVGAVTMILAMTITI